MSAALPVYFRARYLAPMDGCIIEDACLVAESGRIKAVGRASSLLMDRPSGARFMDLGNVVLLPGFVNAHAHLELTCYRNQISSAPLHEWILALIRLRRLPDSADQERAGIMEGIRESLAAGVTCIGDITRTGFATPMLAASPLRGVSFLELISGAQHAPNDAASLRRVYASLVPLDQGAGMRLGISPHAPGTVRPADFDEAIEYAASQGLRVTMHFLETAAEYHWLRQKPAPAMPENARGNIQQPPALGPDYTADFVRKSAMYTDAMLLAHVNYADDDILQQIAAGGASVVWCPRAHRYFNHAPHPWRAMQTCGINVCVGTDSAICVPSLSILEELREIRRQAPAVPVETLFQMATRNGAKALGLDAELGSLTSGKRADFVAIPLDERAPGDVLAHVLDENCHVTEIFLGGDRLSLDDVA